jgi:hypothetical protein
MHQFERMQMKFLAEGGVEQSDNQEPVNDLIHRRFEVTNLISGNCLYSGGHMNQVKR